jgi:hypothetical protein
MCTLVHDAYTRIYLENTDGDPKYGRGDATQRRTRGQYRPSSLWAAQRLAIGINADWMAVWVEELAAVAATGAAVAPCRPAARSAAAIAG